MAAVGVHQLPNASKIASCSTQSTAMSSDDMLSELPEDIVSQILTQMPTKYAVRTSILSKRWRYSWMFVTNIDFDFDYIDPYHLREVSLKAFVDRVIDSCKSSQIQLFRIHFSSSYVDWSNWIDKAVKLNVCEVDIRVRSMVRLPSSLFTCKTLTRLKIDCQNWSCAYPVNLPCLKTLDVAVESDPFLSAFKLITGCPMLEILSFEVFSPYVFKDYVFNIPTLKQLKLRLVRCTSNINKVVLNLPGLEYLLFNGKLGSLFVVEDLSSLVEASITFGEITSDHLLVELLKAVDRVESLTIDSDYDQLFEVPFIAAPRTFPNMKHLDLKGYWPTRLIAQFLESCPKLKGLCIKELICDHWTEPKLVPACMLTNLTSIKLSNLYGNKSDIQFVEYMLGNAEVLKTIKITWSTYHIKRGKKEKRLCAKVRRLQRASRDCEIRFYP